MAVADVLASLNSGLRKQLMMGDAVSFETQPLPSYGLTKALNGGFPYGRQVLIYGSKSSAKTSFCLEMVGDAQRNGKVCAWVDAEMSYDTAWAKRLGVNTEELIVSEARSINDMVNVGTALIDAGVDVLVVDSITSLLPAVFFKKDGSLKELEDTGQIGAESRDMGRVVKMLNYANNRKKPTLIVLISQTRTNIGAMFSSQQPTGGQATKFYSSVIIRLVSSESENQAISVKRTIGNKVITENVGRKVDWTVQFSKTSPAFMTGSYDFYFKGDRIGVDRIGEVLDESIKYGLVTVSDKGGWHYIGEEKLQGRPTTIDYLRRNQEVLSGLEKSLEEI